MPRFRSTTRDLPAGPPPEVLQQIDVAWERTRVLLDSDLEIHFAVDDMQIAEDMQLVVGHMIMQWLSGRRDQVVVA